MILTNKYNLPEVWVRACTEDGHEKVPGRYSVTELCSPPALRYYQMRYPEKISQDVSDMAWLVFGKAVHAYLEGKAPKDGFAEEKITMELGNGATLVGIPDLWQNNTIDDYKVTSVYSFLLGDKPEWAKQLNICAWLCFYGVGLVTNKLNIHAILRDWVQSKTFNDANYPVCPFHTISIPLWPLSSTGAVIQTGTDDLIDAENGYPRKCRPDEQWQRPTTWAVKMPGVKTAKRVLDSVEKAEYWAAENLGDKKWSIEPRYGENVRCERFCIAREICEQRREESGNI